MGARQSDKYGNSYEMVIMAPRVTYRIVVPTGVYGQKSFIRSTCMGYTLSRLTDGVIVMIVGDGEGGTSTNRGASKWYTVKD